LFILYVMIFIMNHKKGFTLLEILLVVGIISILAGIVIVAINPSKQLATVRNTERKSDIKQIYSALTQYYITNSKYPAGISSSLTEICDTGDLASSTTAYGGGSCSGLVNLSQLVPTYVTAIPKDPQASTTNGAGYQVMLNAGKIGVLAPAELDQVIVIGIATSTTPIIYDEATIVAGLREGLIAYYPFDNDADDYSDSASNDGSWSGDEKYTDSKAGLGQAADFDGSNSVFVGSLPVDSNAFSFSAFVYINSLSDSAIKNLFRTGRSGFFNSVALYQWSDNTLVYYYPEMHTGTIHAGTWYHVAITYGGGVRKLYLNGSLVRSDSYPYDFSGSDQLFIGSDTWNQAFSGKIDELGYWNRALSNSEVLNLCRKSGSVCLGRSLVQ